MRACVCVRVCVCVCECVILEAGETEYIVGGVLCCVGCLGCVGVG